MSQSENLGELATALCAAQAEMPSVAKGRTARIDSQKGSYSYDYADLADVMRAAAPVLAGHKLAVTQSFDSNEHGIFLRSMLLHASGEWIDSTLLVTNGGATRPQDLGSLITYMRRYAYCALVGIAAEEDDDAQGAQKAKPPAKPRAPRKPAAVKAAATATGWGLEPIGWGLHAKETWLWLDQGSLGGHRHQHVHKLAGGSVTIDGESVGVPTKVRDRALKIDKHYQQREAAEAS